MTAAKTIAMLAVAAFVSSSSLAVAQTAGTSLDGTSNGVEGTPGHPTPSNPMANQAGMIEPNGTVTDATGARPLAQGLPGDAAADSASASTSGATSRGGK